MPKHQKFWYRGGMSLTNGEEDKQKWVMDKRCPRSRPNLRITSSKFWQKKMKLSKILIPKNRQQIYSSNKLDLYSRLKTHKNDPVRFGKSFLKLSASSVSLLPGRYTENFQRVKKWKKGWSILGCDSFETKIMCKQIPVLPGSKIKYVRRKKYYLSYDTHVVRFQDMRGIIVAVKKSFTDPNVWFLKALLSVWRPFQSSRKDLVSKRVLINTKRSTAST